MVLDNDTAVFLGQFTQDDTPALHELEVVDARAALKEMTRIADIPPVSVGRVTQQTLVTNSQVPFDIRIYQPQALDSAGMLVLFHGGGWVLGDLDSHDNMSRYLCHHAATVVVSVDYRLAPEHPFPAGLDDCVTATRWAFDHAAELGSNNAKLAVIGDSAGGNLAAVVCQLSRQTDAPNIAKQVLLYPCVDLNENDAFASREQFGSGEFFLSSQDLKWLTQMYLPNGAAHSDARVSPLYARDLTRLPKTLVITAGHDILRDEGREYARRLELAGNQVVFREYESTIHGFCSFGGVIGAGREALKYVAEWLRE